MAEREDLDEFTKALYRIRSYHREGNVQGLIDELGNPLEGRKITVRGAATERLARLGDPRAVPPLIELLSDPRWNVRSIAGYALGRIGHPDAVEPLLVTLTDPSPIVRGQSALALGHIGDRRALEPLIALLCDHDRNVRRAAAKGLAEIGDPASIPALEAARKREPFFRRRQFWRALRSLRKARRQGNRP